MIKIQIQILRTDNDSEYFNFILRQYLIKCGIFHKVIVLENPNNMKFLKEKNHHLLGIALAIMFTHHVSNLFWGEAILTTSYLINRLPLRILNFKTPLNTLLSFYPHTHLFTNLHVKTFGCTTLVHTSKPNFSKLEPRVIKCIFLYYSQNKKDINVIT